MSDPCSTKTFDAATDLAVDVSEVAFSSYNPTTLGHLRQPVPSDLPAHLDPSVFTFQDAFEDLLTVSQGNQIPDINSRYQQSRLMRQMYPNGEPTWLWIRRLESQGLIRQPQRSIIMSSSGFNWIEFQQGLEEGAEKFWRGIRDGADEPKNREAVAKVGQVFRELRDQFSSTANNYSPESRDIVKKQEEADNFDELYSAIKSTSSNDQGTWDAFTKAVNEDLPRRMEEFERQGQHKLSDNKPTTVNDSDSNLKQNTKETKSEYVDVFGYKHTTIKRQTYDENGKEIGSSTSIIIKPAGKDDQNALENGNKSSDDSNSDTKSNKKHSWFW